MRPVPELVFVNCCHLAARNEGQLLSEDEFGRNLGAAGFEVLEMRRTFLNGASLLVWARKNATE